MPTVKYRVALNPSERKKLEHQLAAGKMNKRAAMHASILLLADENRDSRKMSEQAIAIRLDVNSQTVHAVRRRFAQQGLEAAIHRKHRVATPGRTRISPDVRKRIVALSQSEPPEGKSRWTLRLLAHHACERQIIDRISHETIGQVLKNASREGII